MSTRRWVSGRAGMVSPMGIHHRGPDRARPVLCVDGASPARTRLALRGSVHWTDTMDNVKIKVSKSMYKQTEGAFKFKSWSYLHNMQIYHKLIKIGTFNPMQASVAEDRIRKWGGHARDYQVKGCSTWNERTIKINESPLGDLLSSIVNSLVMLKNGGRRTPSNAILQHDFSSNWSFIHGNPFSF